MPQAPRLALTCAFLASAAAAHAQQGPTDTLQPPAPAEQVVLAPATSSIGSTDILISVLALLLVGAALAQNARARD